MSLCWRCSKYETCPNRGHSYYAGRNCKEREAVIVVDNYYLVDNKQCFHTFLDASSSCGNLRFSHEIDIKFNMNEGKIEFLGGWEMNCCGDWTWEKEELVLFEESHPGLLESIEKAMNEKKGVRMI